MLEAFKLGGWGMWPTLLFGLLFVVASVRYAATPERRFVPLLVSLGVLTLVAGLLGFTTGLIATTQYLGHVATAEQTQVFYAGFGESLHNVGLALLALMVGSLATTIGTLRGARPA